MPGCEASAVPISAGSMPLGAPSRRIRPESRIRPKPPHSISAHTVSAAMPSAWSNPVVTMITPAAMAATDDHRSARLCR